MGVNFSYYQSDFIEGTQNQTARESERKLLFVDYGSRQEGDGAGGKKIRTTERNRLLSLKSGPVLVLGTKWAQKKVIYSIRII